MFVTYKLRPQRVKAVQFNDDNKNQVLLCLTGQYSPGVDEYGQPVLKVANAKGEVARVCLGDWIVEDTKRGTYYPVTDLMFRMKYEKELASPPLWGPVE